MKYNAAELMEKAVVTVDPAMSLQDLAVLLDEEEIHGTPIVDENGAPIGVVSRTDLAREIVEELEGVIPPSPFYQGFADDMGPLDFTPPRPEQIGLDKRVDDIVSTRLVTAPESATAKELAAMMLREKVHRILITREGRLAGIVSSTDLLRALLGEPGKKKTSDCVEA